MAMIATELNTASYPTDVAVLPYSALSSTFTTGPFQVDASGNTVLNQPGIYTIQLSAIGRSATVQLSSNTATFAPFLVQAAVDNVAPPPANAVPLSGRTYGITSAMIPVTVVVTLADFEPGATRAFLDFQLVRVNALAL